MPWTLDTPIVSPHGDLDIVIVTSFIADNIKGALKINYHVGKIEDSEFIRYQIKYYLLDGDDFVALITSQPESPTQTWYTLLKDLVYTILHENGAIGDGTLT